MFEHSNTSYILHNVKIQGYPVQQDNIRVSVYQVTQKTCAKGTCYNRVVREEETAKFYDVPDTLGTLIAYDRTIALEIDDEFIEPAAVKSYDSTTGTLVVTLS